MYVFSFSHVHVHCNAKLKHILYECMLSLFPLFRVSMVLDRASLLAVVLTRIGIFIEKNTEEENMRGGTANGSRIRGPDKLQSE